MADVVALTGASGFIGGVVGEAVLRTGGRLRVLARRPDRASGTSPAEVVPGSLADTSALARLVAGASAVVHVAGAIKARTDDEFFAVNAVGTQRLAKAAAAAGCRVLLISSLAAREPQLSAYAASKRAAEQAVAACGTGVPTCIIRPPAVYGPSDPAMLEFFRQFAKGVAFIPAVPGARFSLLFVEDLADLVIRLLQRAEWQGEIIEPDDGHADGYAWSDVIATASTVIGRRIRPVRLPYWMLRVPAWLSAKIVPLAGRAPVFTPGKLRELFHPDWVCRPSDPALLGGWRASTRLPEGFAATWSGYRERKWI